MRREVTFRGSTCFGCGAENPQGLQLRFFETDEGVEVDYVSPPHLDGAPGIIHGGIQGTLLDEAMCMAVYAKRGIGVVTGELTVRYRKPVPSGTPLVVRGRILEQRGRSFLIEGGIHLAETGEELTRARGRFFLAPEMTYGAPEHEHEEGR
jgi:acyl-coenzyme A thioesterase PaaI-like protein